MKKKFLSVLLTLCMVLTLLPATALAANVSSAQTLADALNAITSGCCGVDTTDTTKVTMRQDVTLTDTISITSGTVILDLAGCTITGANGKNSYTYSEACGKTALAVTGGALTILDGASGGKVIGGNGNGSANTWRDGPVGGDGLFVNGGVVTISGGTLEGGVGGTQSMHTGGRGGYGIFVQSGMVSVSGSTFTGGAGGGGSSSGAQGSAVVINGGSVSGNLSGTPTNGSGTEVQLYTLTVNRADGSALADTAVTALTATDKLGYTYGMTDVKTDANGKLYVYLPAGKTAVSVTAGGVNYSGSVTDSAATLLPPQARWGTDDTYAAGGGTLTDAVTYANGLADGTAYIQLLSDVKIASMLEFSSGKTTVLDLNGFDIDRGSTTENESSVLNVQGSLTLKDTSANAATAPGKITGGRFMHIGGVNVSVGGSLVMEGGSITGNTACGGSGGGGVCVGGSFTMTGGSITGNTCESGGGGGVFVSGGSFTMTGGSITGNNADLNGGGVYVSGGSLTLGGAAEITGNTRVAGSTSAPNNIYLEAGRTIAISPALTNTTPIGVNMHAPGVFTTGNTVTNSDYLSRFTADSANFAVRAASGNQLQLAKISAIEKAIATHGTFTVKVGNSEVESAAAGDTVTITPTAASGYALDKLTVAKTGDTNTTVTVTNNSFTMPDYPVTVTVSFNAASTPGTSSGGGTAPAVTVPVSSDAGKVSVSASVTNGTASVSVTDSQLKAIVSDSADTGTVKVDVSGLKNVTAASVSANLIGAAAKASGGKGLTVSVPGGSVALDSTALGAVNTGNTVVVSVDPVAREKLSDSQRASVPENAVIVDVNVLVNGAKVHDFSGGKITVSIPYTPKTGENPDSVTVWYLEDNGSLTPMNGKYDPASGMVVFTTTHLSQYVIGSFPFTDVPGGAYYYPAVVWAVGNGVTDGTSATTFSPDGVCTRAQAVTFLWRAMGSPEPTGKAGPFTDAAADAYYYKAVQWAVKKGITLGTSAATFSPGETVSRAQAMTFLWRAAGKPAAGTANPFADVAAGAYYESAVLWAAAQKITQGTAPGAFSPANPCTRAQIVTFLYRYLGK